MNDSNSPSGNSTQIIVALLAIAACNAVYFVRVAMLTHVPIGLWWWAANAAFVGLLVLAALSPNRRVTLASLGILMSVWAWNQFLLALVLVEDPTQRTMAGALGAFQGHYATDIPLLSAGTILILLPTLILFIVFQRQVIAALLQGSVKG